MKELAASVERALPHIGWFAQGEAIRLSAKVQKVLKNGDDAAVLDVAKKSAEFLNRQSTNEARELARNLRLNLDRLEMTK